MIEILKREEFKLMYMSRITKKEKKMKKKKGKLSPLVMKSKW